MLHTKSFRRIWQLLITAATVLASVYFPLQLALELELIDNFTLFYSILSLLFFFDALYNLYSARRSNRSGEPGEPHYSNTYMTVWFIIDVTAALPLGFFTAIPWIHLNKLLKLLRIANYMRQWRQRAVGLSDYLKFGFFLFWLALSAHLLACGWLQLHTGSNADDETRYVNSLYWSVQTLTTVGYGDVSPVNNLQRIYTMLVMVFGVGIYGYLIGNVVSIFAKSNPAREYYFRNLDRLQTFVRYRKLPPGMQKKIKDYYSYIWQKRWGLDEEAFIESLPPGLKEEVSLFLRREAVDKIPLFQGSGEDFLREIAMQLKPIVLAKNDFLFKEGDVGNEMFFLLQGELEIIAKESGVIATLHDGDFFGEIALFHNIRRTASVRATCFSDLYVLHRNVFEIVGSRFPDIKNTIIKKAEERLKQQD